MATANGNYVSDNSTLANFQSWAGAIHSAITAFGWVQTSDTGQTVPSAAASVPSNAYNYVIYKANDSLAASMPIYLKFEYGYSSTSPRIRMTVGTSSNGSGTITGNVVSSAPWEITTLESNQGSTTFPCFFSGDAGNFRMYMWQSPVINTGVFFSIARSVNSSGAGTSDYFTVLSASAYYGVGPNTGLWQQTISSSYVYFRENGFIGIGITAGSGTGAASGTVAAYPIFPHIGKIGNPLLDVMGACGSDVADGATVTVASMYGSTHSYIALKSPSTAWQYGFSVAIGKSPTDSIWTLMALLMRYE